MQSRVFVLGFIFGCGLVRCGGEATTLADSSSASGDGGSGAASPQGGSASTGGNGGTTSTGGSGGSGTSECQDIDGVALVANKFYLGDTEWDGSPSVNAWKQYGSDLDSQLTANGDLTGHCSPAVGASPNVMNDGDSGIDNSWGKNLLPLVLGLAPDTSAQINAGISAGSNSSFSVKIDSLGSGPDQTPLVSRLYEATPLLTPAKFDGTDCWPVAQESLTVPTNIDSALTVFAESELADNVWNSGGAGEIQLNLGTAGFALPVVLRHARIAMTFDTDHQSASLGILSGVLSTEEFIAALQQAAGSFDPSLCRGSTFEALANQIRQASDIMSDGTQDETATCNAISFGMGFDATAIRFGKIAPEKVPPPNPCDR